MGRNRFYWRITFVASRNSSKGLRARSEVEAIRYRLQRRSKRSLYFSVHPFPLPL
jgi:hypothetical protein